MAKQKNFLKLIEINNIIKLLYGFSRDETIIRLEQ